MDYLRKTIEADKLSGIFDIPPVFRNRRAEVIILFSDKNTEEKPKPQKRQLGFAKGAEIPDSFFEPLSEEELQLWGL